ncbi:MAG: peptidase M48, partial [Calditrichaeota bacterium]|nr:peptidase M48 [Calditrichota bacterium]
MIREDIVIDHSRSNLLHTVLLLGSMMGLLALLGFLLSGTTGVVMALAAGVFLFFFGPRISPQLLLRMYRARALS